MTSRLIVCRTAWMEHYRGVTGEDTPNAGGSYVKERGFGHEAFNFEPLRNEYFGYVRATGSGVNLRRLGGSREDSELNGVTVAWVAAHPLEGGTRLVGWYQNATVFAEYQDLSKTKGRRLPDGKVPSFLTRAPVAVLLDRDERVYDVPRGTATTVGMGQSNIWYPDEDSASPILEYIGRGGRLAPVRARHGRPRLQDVERRLRIEKAAMEAAAAWFADPGYEVDDVSMNRLGWDLEARRGRARLLIEVKGTSSDARSCVVEVTPNEFAKMNAEEHRAVYRLCVVTSCGSTPEVSVYAWGLEDGSWTTGDGASRLEIKEQVAARISLVFS